MTVNPPEKNSDLADVFLRASIAQKEISSLPIKQRARMIQNLIKVLLKRTPEIVDKIVAETGKNPNDALMSEVFPALDHLAYFSKTCHRFLGDRKVATPITLLGKKSKICFEPLGTILIITPWNYPFFQGLVPFAVSFLSGNATLLKPSEFTPLQGLLESVVKEAGFGEHWIQVLYGDGKLGKDLIAAKPDKIFFTGSVATGKAVMTQAALHLIPVELELGGKDVMIVFDDVDLRRAVNGALWGACTNAGQSCTSVERILVHESIYTNFKNLLVSEAKKVAPFLGKITTPAQLNLIRAQISEAQQNSRTVIFGGEWDGTSALIPPVTIEEPSMQASVWTQETFGPLMPLHKFNTEEEAIRLANDSEYGLSASVWSGDLERAMRVAKNLKVGNVTINNVMMTEANPGLPFGGIKNSGFGRFKGEFGFHSFSNIKSIITEPTSTRSEIHWYPYTHEKYQGFLKLIRSRFDGGIFGILKFAYWGLRLERLAKWTRSVERKL